MLPISVSSPAPFVQHTSLHPPSLSISLSIYLYPSPYISHSISTFSPCLSPALIFFISFINPSSIPPPPSLVLFLSLARSSSLANTCTVVDPVRPRGVEVGTDRAVHADGDAGVGELIARVARKRRNSRSHVLGDKRAVHRVMSLRSRAHQEGRYNGSHGRGL